MIIVVHHISITLSLTLQGLATEQADTLLCRRSCRAVLGRPKYDSAVEFDFAAMCNSFAGQTPGKLLSYVLHASACCLHSP